MRFDRTESEGGIKIYLREIGQTPLLTREDEVVLSKLIKALDARHEKYPEYVKRVIAAYEKARQWAIQNPGEYRKILVRDAKLNDAVAAKVLERTDITQPAIGDVQKQTIAAAGSVLKKSGVIKETVDVDGVVADLIDPQYGQAVIK